MKQSGIRRRVELDRIVELLNEDVLVEVGESWLDDGRIVIDVSVVVVGCAERFVFKTDLDAARDYARLEARRRGTRAFERTTVGYTPI